MNERSLLRSVWLLLSIFTFVAGKVVDIGPHNFLHPEIISENQVGFEKEQFRYSFFEMYLGFTEAQMVCESQGNKSKLAQVKTKSVAEFLALAAAETDMELEACWIGAKVCSAKQVILSDGKIHEFCWEDGTRFNLSSSMVQEESGTTFDIPWANRTKIQKVSEKDNRHCIAFQRRMHDDPLFVNMNCNNKRPFICQSLIQNQAKETEIVNTGENDNIRYFIVLAKYNWKEAMRYCLLNKMKIATPEKPKDVLFISNLMLRSRPVLEMAWINGRYEESWNDEEDTSAWKTLSNYRNIEYYPMNTKNNSDFPPWRTDKEIKQVGCLLLDRHKRKTPVFQPARCQRKRSFICEKPITDDRTPVDIFETIGPFNYSIVYKKITWSKAREYCFTLQMRLIAPYTSNGIQYATTMMAEARRGAVRHTWINFKFNVTKNQWFKESDYNVTFESSEKNSFVHMIHTPKPKMHCLNMDVENFHEPQFYGLACKTRQAAICVNCQKPSNGTDMEPAVAEEELKLLC